MSVRANWASAQGVEVEVTDDFTDQYGTEIDDDKYGLILGADGDFLVVEGTLDELEEFVERVLEKIRAWD